MAFSRKEVSRTHLVFFQKRRFQGFMSEILRVISFLGEKFFFATPLGQHNFLGFSDILFIFILSSLYTFQNNSNYSSTSKIQEVIKLYNLGDKCFETDFSSAQSTRYLQHCVNYARTYVRMRQKTDSSTISGTVGYTISCPIRLCKE